MASDIDGLKKRLLGGRKKAKPEPVQGLGSGLTRLNLACSGHLDWAFAVGSYNYIVGDTESGKTFISLTMAAEAALNKSFRKHRLIFDNPDQGARMDMNKFFGAELVRRLEEPSKKGSSRFLEDFYYNLDDACESGQDFVYILDDMDTLIPEEDYLHFQEMKKASRNGKQIRGSYGTAKAKINSNLIRIFKNRIKETQSILIVISQTRDNIGWDAMARPKTRAGGNSLSFYADCEFWTSVKEHMKTVHEGKDNQTGSRFTIKIRKNRYSGQHHKIIVPFYHSYGFDDTGDMIAWLVEAGHWHKEGRSITAKELAFRGTPEKLVERIESEGREGELRKLVQEVWQQIEQACEIKRKRRYE